MSPSQPVHHGFAIDQRYRGVLRLFGVLSAEDAFVELDDEVFSVRFGYWMMRVPVANLAGAEVAGPFGALKVLGVHLSFADRGITFGTNTASGVCVRFHQPVPGIEPLGVLRHPGVTITVDDPGVLAHAVNQRAAALRTAAISTSRTDRQRPARREGQRVTQAEDTDGWTEIEEPQPGEVRRVARWAVGTSHGEPFAVGRRCRHQLRDLSDGRVDDAGCLVCPWHHARYDVGNGQMVDGPRGVAFYVGPTPGYTQLVRALARWVPLRVGRAVRRGRSILVR